MKGETVKWNQSEFYFSQWKTARDLCWRLKITRLMLICEVEGM